MINQRLYPNSNNTVSIANQVQVRHLPPPPQQWHPISATNKSVDNYDYRTMDYDYQTPVFSDDIQPGSIIKLSLCYSDLRVQLVNLDGSLSGQTINLKFSFEAYFCLVVRVDQQDMKYCDIIFDESVVRLNANDQADTIIVKVVAR